MKIFIFAAAMLFVSPARSAEDLAQLTSAETELDNGDLGMEDFERLICAQEEKAFSFNRGEIPWYKTPLSHEVPAFFHVDKEKFELEFLGHFVEDPQFCVDNLNPGMLTNCFWGAVFKSVLTFVARKTQRLFIRENFISSQFSLELYLLKILDCSKKDVELGAVYFIQDRDLASEKHRDIYDSAMREIAKKLGYKNIDFPGYGCYYYLSNTTDIARFDFKKIPLETRREVVEILIHALTEIRETPLPSVITVHGEEGRSSAVYRSLRKVAAEVA